MASISVSDSNKDSNRHKGSKAVPRAVALVGATGIGKTHLLMHGREYCDSKNVPVHVASAPSIDREQKYLVWKALLGKGLGLGLGLCGRRC